MGLDSLMDEHDMEEAEFKGVHISVRNPDYQEEGWGAHTFWDSKDEQKRHFNGLQYIKHEYDMGTYLLGRFSEAMMEYDKNDNADKLIELIEDITDKKISLVDSESQEEDSESQDDNEGLSDLF